VPASSAKKVSTERVRWERRGCGLSIDNLISADVVTAEGKFVTASADENEDLFWGLRGGGGNLLDLPTVRPAGRRAWPGLCAGQVVRWLCRRVAGRFLRRRRESSTVLSHPEISS
jgi:hypothetical protein